MLKLIAYLTTSLFTVNLLAQTPIQSGIHAIGLTGTIAQIKDKNLAPVVHSGRQAGLLYRYTQTGDNLTQIEFHPAYAQYKNVLEFYWQSFAINTDLNLAHLRPVSQSDQKQLHVGAGLNYFSSLNYFEYWDEQHIYWASSINLSLNAQFKIEAERATHKWNFKSPILAMVSRPAAQRLWVIDDISFKGFAGYLHSNFELGSFNRHRGFQLKYEYQINRLKKPISLGIATDLHRYNTSISKPMQTLNYTFFTQINL